MLTLRKIAYYHGWSLLAVLLAVALSMFAHAPTWATTVFAVGMIVDAQTQLSNAQVFNTVATVVSTNTYDTGAAGRNIAAGRRLGVMFTVDVSADAGNNDETYRFELIQSANADLSAPDVLVATNTAYLTRALLVAGYKFFLEYPPHLKTKRYLGWQLVAAGTTPSITVSANIIPSDFVQNEAVYPKNFTITS